tara:strand:- start:714 stop:950 length:237 start_codon:yes stop_codon:yes gene_type:complete
MSEAIHMLELNLIGYVCPIPVFETKKRIEKMSSGEKLKLICDDSDVQYDIPKLAKRLSLEILGVHEDSGVWEITLLIP